MSNSIKTILIIIFALSILGAFSVASAAINKQFNYQGKLTDDAGVAVADVAHNIKFIIYDAASGGNCLWTARGSCGSETARSITPSSGLFSVMLGDTAAGDNAIGLNFDTDSYYLGITVESDAEMTPRKRIGAVPQAFNALNLIGSGYIDIDNISTAQDALNINYNPASGAYGAVSITYGLGGGTGIALTVTQSGTGDILNLFDGSTEVFTILDGGNVGIGTDTPSETLEVIGSLKVDTINSIIHTSDGDFNAGTASNTTVSGGSVILSEKICGSYSVTFNYRGSSVTYGTVSHNGECWLNRNLGASQVATAYNDYSAYGDLFQWGRLDDGHQTIVWTSSSGSDGAEQSRETDVNSDDDEPGPPNSDYFIREPNIPYDWRVPQNNNLWQGVSGINNPCPTGWRIPTEAELETERASWSSNDYNGAYASPLKLTAAGRRDCSTGSLTNAGGYGYYWSSAIDGTLARNLLFLSSNALVHSYGRAYGFSVRCLED